MMFAAWVGNSADNAFLLILVCLGLAGMFIKKMNRNGEITDVAKKGTVSLLQRLFRLK